MRERAIEELDLTKLNKYDINKDEKKQKMEKEYKEYMTIKEVAQKFRVSTSTVYRLIKQKKIGSYQIGGKGGSWRISSEEFEKWKK